MNTQVFITVGKFAAPFIGGVMVGWLSKGWRSRFTHGRARVLLETEGEAVCAEYLEKIYKDPIHAGAAMDRIILEIREEHTKQGETLSSVTHEAKSA